jgi:Holliday junction resolvase
MAKADSKRGIQRERDLVNALRDEGWFALRAPASLGVADVVALKDGERPRLTEVKSTKAGPYAGFGPADRKALAEAADRAGADAFLYWHPPRRKPQWIPRSDWPDAA